MSPKKRHKINDVQRRNLRVWAKQQENPPTLKDAARWFREEYHRIALSSAHEILGPEYEYLDHDNALESRSRRRTPMWPGLEAALCCWCNLSRLRGHRLTKYAVTEAATYIWERMSHPPNVRAPGFSSGWYSGFLNRINLHKASRFWDEPSPSTAHVISTLNAHAENDVYCVDDTGLCWLQHLSRSTHIPGKIITIMFCCNATGDDRFPPLIIGNTERPHALRDVHIDNLGVQWRADPNVYMTISLIEEWLQRFQCHVGDRKVLLFMNDTPINRQACERFPLPSNITVIFSSPTALGGYHRPFQLGIIHSFKILFRKYYLEYMLECMQRQRNPLEDMSIYYTLRWIGMIWHRNNSKKFIRHSFKRSLILANEPDSPYPTPVPELEDLYRQVLAAGNIQDPKDFSDFLNPLEDIALDGAHRWATSEEEDMSTGPPPPPSSPETVVKAAKTIISHLQQQPRDKTSTIAELYDLINEYSSTDDV